MRYDRPMKRVSPAVKPPGAAQARDGDEGWDESELDGHRHSFERIAVRPGREAGQVEPHSTEPTSPAAELEPAVAPASKAQSGVVSRIRPGSIEALAVALAEIDLEEPRSGEELARTLRVIANRFEAVPTTWVRRDDSDYSETHHVGVLFAHYKLRRLAGQYVVTQADAIALCKEIEQLAVESATHAELRAS